MSDTTPGRMIWLDLTVEDAPRLRDFYADVVGWTPEAVAMDGYDDYAMADAGGIHRTGICHARGPNAGIPPQWIPYFAVDDLDARLAAAGERGAERLVGPQGTPRFAILRDPAGAIFAIGSSGD